VRIDFDPFATQDDDEDVVAAPVLETKLIRELGPRLPFGIRDDATGEISRRIAFEDWTFETEKRLSKRRDKMQTADLPTFVSVVLAETVSVLGPYDFVALSKGKGKSAAFTERQTRIASMLMGDVYFAYLMLRIHAIGPTLRMRFRCVNCKTSYELPVDLESAEVRIADSLEPLIWRYTLEKPLEVAGKKAVAFGFGPMRWSSLMGVDVTSAGVVAGAKMSFIRDSVRAVITEDGTELEVKPSEADLAPMAKRDIEAIASEIDSHQPGPDMSIEHDCAKCEHENRFPLDWGYDGFFGTSSR
jgi:hypothetical protein